MPTRKNLLSNPSWCGWIMDAIVKIKMSRQRPTFGRVCQALRKRHIFHEDTIAAKLKEAERSGLIEAVFLRGELTYRLVHNVNKQIRYECPSRKSGPVPNVLCIECLKTSLSGPNHKPEPMSSCERCGISLHDSCSNKSNDHKTSVPLSQLVSAGNHWFCEECKSCDVCNSMNESLSRAHCCLVECVGCGRKFHFQCMVPSVNGLKKIRLPWRCVDCTQPNECSAGERYGKHSQNGNRSTSPETDIKNLKITVVLNKFSGKCSKDYRTQPTEAELIEGRVQAMKIKLAGKVTGDDLDIFRQVLLQRCSLQEDNLERTPAAIRFGRHEIETWYSSPFPQEYAKLKVLFICEFCLKYMKTGDELRRHQHKCSWRYPPGSEIYRDGNLSVFEVDGNRQKLYCQSLCLLAKLFLDHKTLYFDVEPFLFYILTKRDNLGHHIVGYFSKEKSNQLRYNVSCILTMPQYQRQGYGRFLIDFSYLLSRVEQRPGTPERPLSDLGRLSYHQYWCSELLSYLYFNRYEPLTLESISRDTGMIVGDIVTALRKLHFIKYRVEKMGCIRANRPIICIDWRLVHEHCSRMNRSVKRIKLQEMCLRWIPNLRAASFAEHIGVDNPDLMEDTSRPANLNNISIADDVTGIDLKILPSIKSEEEHEKADNSTKSMAKANSPSEEGHEEKPIVARSPLEEDSKDTEYSAEEDFVARTSTGRKRSRSRKYSEALYDLSLSLTTGTPKSNRPKKSASSAESKDSCTTVADVKFPIVPTTTNQAIVDVHSRVPITTGTDEEISLDSVEAFMGTPKSELQKSPPGNPAHGFTPIAPFRHQSGGNDRRTDSSPFGDGVSHQLEPYKCTPKGRARLLHKRSPTNDGRTISKCRKRTSACLQEANGCKRQRLEWPACEGSVVERSAYDATKDGKLTPQRRVTLMEVSRPTRLSGRGRPSEGSTSKFISSNERVLPQTV